MNQLPKIQDFEGFQYPLTVNPIERKEYDTHNVQYATSSDQEIHDMYPGLIVYPKNDDNIIKTIKFATANYPGVKYPIAVVSGGHQYSGACSTNKDGIQLNLGTTYTNANDLAVLPTPAPPNDKQVWVLASVSTSLGSFNQFLKSNKLFVPHGQCADVHIGGHAQTGGYGQLGRAFGLIGDHVRGIRMINYNAEVQEVTKDNDPDLFNAILGGSPGNFGIITHYTIQVHQDKDHDFPSPAADAARPHGFKGVWLYSESILKKLLNEVAEIADNPDFPRNFDLCVSVLSSSFPILKMVEELDEEAVGYIRGLAKRLTGSGADQKWPSSIVVYAQWVPMNADDKYTDKVDAWFQKFQSLNSFWHHWNILSNTLVKPMSEMTGEWIFHRDREFDHPYVKRTYMTSSTTLVKDKWVDLVSDRINMVMSPFDNFFLWENCYLSVQIQPYGGKYSQYYVNRNNGTSYSWRDSTVCQVLDCFHKEGKRGKELAEDWQAGNDKVMCGPDSAYSKQDKRVLWGSYGDWDLHKTWPFYFEDQAKYEKIGKQRSKADPMGIFTPNPFNVKPA